MNQLFSFVLVAIFSISAFAKLEAISRVDPVKKTVTLEIDGRFPAGLATDVLFVVDDSGSMGTHQQNLKNHIKHFANQAVKVSNDFQIGITNTNFRGSGSFGGLKDPGHLYGDPTIITPATPKLLATLQNNLALGTNGSGDESVFEPALIALDPASQNGLVRDSAHLAVVFLSDARDQSKISAWDFVDSLVDLKGDFDKVSLQAIITTTEDLQAKSCKGDSIGSNTPHKIEEAVRLLNGNVFSLCSTQMAQDITKMSESIFPPYPGKYSPAVQIDFVDLVSTPISGTIKVQFGRQTISEDPQLGWTYDETNNQVVFASGIEWKPQVDGAKILVTYSVN